MQWMHTTTFPTFWYLKYLNWIRSNYDNKNDDVILHNSMLLYYFGPLFVSPNDVITLPSTFEQRTRTYWTRMEYKQAFEWNEFKYVLLHVCNTSVGNLLRTYGEHENETDRPLRHFENWQTPCFHELENCFI